MADPTQGVQSNIEGNFFVDTTCINCDTCRQLAPHTFADDGEYSYVYRQPGTSQEELDALRALLACPTGSIGTLEKADTASAMKDFPLNIADNVYYCGFNSPKSYGGNSYFIHEQGNNWLIDAPKFLPPLVNALEALGGIDTLFLTHRDDVADARQFANHFGCQRIIHHEERNAQPEAEIIIQGNDDTLMGNKVIIPTPGHTKGHCVLLYNNTFLFTGDHLRWNRYTKGLHASQQYCWYSWSEQQESIKKLLNYPFQWVLPGHGQRVHLPEDTMKQELNKLIQHLQEGSL